MKNKVFIKAILIAFLITILFSHNLGFCQKNLQPITPNNAIDNSGLQTAEKDKAEYQIIGFAFRVLAKGFVSMADMEKLKINAINKINKMDEASFHARYMDFYEHIQDDQFFTGKFRLHKDMNKPEAIEKIKSLDKAKLSKIIDSVPDIVVANEFKRYLFKNNQEPPKSNDVKNIFDSFRRMMDEIKQKYLGK